MYPVVANLDRTTVLVRSTTAAKARMDTATATSAAGPASREAAGWE